MNARYRFLLTVFAGGLVFRGDSTALAQESWAGESVIYTKPAEDITFGDVVQGKQIYFPFSGMMPIKVRYEREGWLRIHDGHREGWVDKDDFVRVGDAPAFFDRRVQADPTDTWALFRRGVAWLGKGEPEKALKDFDECIRLNPADNAYFTARGKAWSDTKDYDKAILDYDEAIRLDPNAVLTFFNRAFAWRNKKDYDKAIQDYDEYIRREPKDPDGFHNRGMAWYYKKEYDKALRDLDEAIRLDPKAAVSFYNKACCHALLGRTDPAIASLGQAVELGYRNFDHIAKDSDLASIRADARYQELLKKYAK